MLFAAAVESEGGRVLRRFIRTVLVAGAAGGLVAGGASALKGAPGLSAPAPSAPSVSQLAKVHRDLQARAAAERESLRQLTSQEQGLKQALATVSGQLADQRRQLVAARTQLAATESLLAQAQASQVQASAAQVAPRVHTTTGASGGTAGRGAGDGYGYGNGDGGFDGQ